jgi:hypothetical protein
LLVDLAAKQQEAIVAMAGLLDWLVIIADWMLKDQRKAARTARQWRWATIVVAVIAAAASVLRLLLSWTAGTGWGRRCSQDEGMARG